MYKILVEYEKENATTSLIKRSLTQVFSHLNVSCVFLRSSEITGRHLKTCSIFISIRPNTPISLDIAKAIKRSGLFYIVFFDDDLLNYDMSLKWRKSCTYECLKLADLLITPNPVLGSKYIKITNNKRYVVFDTPIDAEEYSQFEKNKQVIEYVYAAGRDHASIFEDIVRPVLGKFLSKYNDKVHFTFIGCAPDLTGLKEYKECFSFYPLMSLDEYDLFMKNRHFDYGLSPLHNDSFSNCKYFNKYIEYSKVGIVGLYSNCLPYTLIVSDLENGYLVDNSQSEWYRILEKTIFDVQNREKMLLNAQNILKERFTLNALVETVKNEIPEILENNCSYTVIYKQYPLKNFLFSVCDKVSKIKGVYKKSGVKGSVAFLINYISDRIK